MSAPLTLSIDGLTFKRVPLQFVQSDRVEPVFAGYEKTLGQTLQERRYKGLLENEKFKQSYLSEVEAHKPLGSFLRDLKLNGDDFYKEFLNPYGDEKYCEFSIQGDLAARKGLYCYTVNGDVKYIGRCRDSFKKRVNQSYGVIYPKKCYLDGQATNCHLNSLIAKERGEIGFWVHPLENNTEIKELEERLIRDPKRRLEWNIALNNKQPEVQDPPSWGKPTFIAGVVCALLGMSLVVASLFRWKQSQ
jgi:hypothetical protein